MGEGRGCGRLGSRIRGGWVQDDVGMGVREKEERDGERERMWERDRDRVEGRRRRGQRRERRKGDGCIGLVGEVIW